MTIKSLEGAMYRATLLMGEIQRSMERLGASRVSCSIFLDRMARLDRFPIDVLIKAGIFNAYMDAREVRKKNPSIGEQAALGIDLEYLHFPDWEHKEPEYKHGYVGDALMVANIIPWIPHQLRELVTEAVFHAEVNIGCEPEVWIGLGAVNEAQDRVDYEFANPSPIKTVFDEVLDSLLGLEEWAKEIDEPCPGKPSEEALAVFNRCIAEHEAKQAKRRKMLN